MKKQFKVLLSIAILLFASTLVIFAQDGTLEEQSTTWKIIGGSGGVLTAILAIWKVAKVFINKFGKTSGEVVDVVTVSITELSLLGMKLSEGIGGFRVGFKMLEESTKDERTPTKAEMDLMLGAFKTAWDTMKIIKPEFDNSMVKIRKEIKDVTTSLKSK